MIFFKILWILGCLGLAFYGVRLFSRSLRFKLDLDLFKWRKKFKKNIVSSFWMGFLAVLGVQSSWGTAHFLMGGVQTGFLTLKRGFPILWGLHGGATLLMWIYAILAIDTFWSDFFMLFLAAGYLLFVSSKQARHEWGLLCLSIGMIFLGIDLLKETLKLDLHELEGVKEFFRLEGGLDLLFQIAGGLCLAMLLRSLSATFIIVLVLAQVGILSPVAAGAFLLGENLGSAILIFLNTREMKGEANKLAGLNVLFHSSVVFVMGLGLQTFLAPLFKFLELGDTPPGLCMAVFYTLFHLTYALLLLLLKTPFMSIVERFVPAAGENKKLGHELSGLSPEHPLELKLFHARNRVGMMSDRVYEMILRFLQSTDLDQEPLKQNISIMKNLEDQVDELEIEINRFLMECSRTALNEQHASEIRILYRITLELERMADEGWYLVRILKRLDEKNLHKFGMEEIRTYCSGILDLVQFVFDQLKLHFKDKKLTLITSMETAIEEQKNKLLKDSRRNIKKGKNLKGEFLYLEVLRHLEHIAHHSLNIAMALSGK